MHRAASAGELRPVPFLYLLIVMSAPSLDDAPALHAARPATPDASDSRGGSRGGTDLAAAAAVPGPKPKNKSIRVSITFKIGFGWRGTKSRDFPGRHFGKQERDIIHSWAKEFRQGKSILLPPKSPDKRVLILPVGAKRRKPFLGASEIRRRDAFYWFRLTQERLMNVEASKISSSQSPDATGVDATCGSSAPQPPRNSIISFASQRRLNVTMLLPNSFVSKSKTQTEFIEVHFDSGSRKSIKEQRVFRFYLDVDLDSADSKEKDVSARAGSVAQSRTIMRIPVNIVECGGGAFFCAANIPPGNYRINGAPFVVQAPPKKVRKKRRKRVMTPTAVEQSSIASSVAPSLADPNASQKPENIPSKPAQELLPISDSPDSLSGASHEKRRRYNSSFDLPHGVFDSFDFEYDGGAEAIPADDISPILGTPYFVANDDDSSEAFQLPEFLLEEKEEDSMRVHLSNSRGGISGAGGGSNRKRDPSHPNNNIRSALNAHNFPDECLATSSESKDIKRLRKILGAALTTGRHAQYPEVVGDISLLRFLRGNKGNVDAAAALFHDHLATRRKFCMDDCRDRCVAQMRAPGGVKFHQTQMINGTLVRAYLPMEYNCGMTLRGDPVSAIWYTGGRLGRLLRENGRDKVLDFTVESFVRRQIQLDMLSRHQGRLTRLVCFMECLGGLWRLLAPGPARDFFSLNIGSTMPEMCSKIYMVNASWAMRTVWQHFTNYMKTYKNRMELLGPDWRKDIAQMIDYSAMSSIINIRQQHHVRHNMGGTMSQGTEGEAGIASGGDYEVAIEVNPEVIAGLRWSWTSRFEQSLAFSVTIVREVEDNDNLSPEELRELHVASITTRRDQVLRGLGMDDDEPESDAVRLRRICILPDYLCCEHHGSYEWESAASGLILLRWTFPPTAWYKCGSDDTIEYNVEVVSKDATIITTLGKARNNASKEWNKQIQKKENMLPRATPGGLHYQVSDALTENGWPEDDPEARNGEWVFNLTEVPDLRGVPGSC